MNDVCLEELDFENTQLKCENIMLKLDGNLLMLDKAFSMYDYVTKYGVDRSFVKVHNTHYELDALAGMIYPCNESFDGFDVDLAKYKQVCMEGILEAITNAVKWVIEKLKALCSWIGEMFNKFLGLFRNKTESNKKTIKELRNMVLMDDDKFDVEYVSPNAVAKYNEILKKVNITTSSGDATTIVPGLTDEEFSTLREGIENFRSKSNDHVDVFTVTTVDDKKVILDITDRNTNDFDKLINIIGASIAHHKGVISDFEKNEQNIIKRLTGNNNTEDKVARDKLAKLKSNIKTYKNTVSILSKLLKLVLDDTNITEKTLSTIGKHIKRAMQQRNNAGRTMDMIINEHKL